MARSREWFFIVLYFVWSSSSGCIQRPKQSLVLENSFVEMQTGLDPSKIAVLSGSIGASLVDKGMKLERKVLQLDTTAIDGVPLRTVRSFCCDTLPVDINEGDSGDFFGNVFISSTGSLSASEYAKSKGIPLFDELIMNSPDFRMTFRIRILGRVN